MAARVALVLALLPLAGVFAFSNTVPFVAWSSQSSDPVLSRLAPGARPNHDALLQDILSSDDVCAYDAVVIVDHPGLHSADLRTLAPACGLASRISDAPSARQLPHVERSLDPSSSPAARLADRCGTRALALDVASTPAAPWSFDAGTTHVLALAMPPVEGSPRYRKTVMAEHERLLSEALDRVAALASNHLVIYAGAPIPHARRALPPLSEFDSPPDAVGPSTGVAAVASPTPGGILHHYQLLTPALITALLIALFIFVPVVLMGISTLASIQSTLRSEAPKDYSAQERKTQ